MTRWFRVENPKAGTGTTGEYAPPRLIAEFATSVEETIDTWRCCTESGLLLIEIDGPNGEPVEGRE